ncbi:hypothetical protein MNBD_NITROSPINAE01-337 [hydrothermal vent metagenome]|uniref:NusB/RsmB/TIM44 domain-containing protein n=1 Tax=hydrothermal vent metagenome TaxID=652676 RepID=A0A3B1CEZ1_9ZZZZ
MGLRHRSREAALKILYQADLRGETDYSELLDDYWSENENENVDRHFAESIIRGVAENISKIDETIKTVSENWDVERLGFIERALLRMAIYELLFTPDTPDNVAIDEAIELAKAYCDKKSAGFVNGILDRAMKAKAS